MWRGLAIALLAVGLLTVPAWAQRRGGGTGFAGHAASGFRGPAVSSRGPVFRGAIAPGSAFRPGGGFRGPVFPNRFGRTRFFFGGGPWVYPWFYPYAGAYYYPGYDGDYGYPDYGYQDYAAPAPYADSAAIEQDQIDRLEDEVDRLRQERENRAQPPVKAQPQTATLLVFQDKHSEEVQNYAIVGQTLWIFTELKARKVPLSDLDLAATTRANEDRGVDFRLPE